VILFLCCLSVQLFLIVNGVTDAIIYLVRRKDDAYQHHILHGLSACVYGSPP